MSRHRFVPGMLLVATLASCQSNSQPAAAPRIREPNAFRHDRSGFEFPPNVGDFVRESKREYDREGLDMSVGYNFGSTMAMTVYVYPNRQAALDEHVAAVKRDIVGRNKDAAIIAEGTTKANVGGQERIGQYTVFTYRTVFARRDQAVRSELRIFTHGSWFIKYRFTYAAGDQATAEPAIRAFLEQLRWPDAVEK